MIPYHQRINLRFVLPALSHLRNANCGSTTIRTIREYLLVRHQLLRKQMRLNRPSEKGVADKIVRLIMEVKEEQNSASRLLSRPNKDHQFISIGGIDLNFDLE